MQKSQDAFRTISEVAEDLDLPQHVLRFWETRFPQVRPLKRAGGRRYYRPADVLLLRSIRQLLHEDGYTIKGVQRLLKEQGAKSLRVGETRVARGLIAGSDRDGDDCAGPEAPPTSEDCEALAVPDRRPASATEACTEAELLVFERDQATEAHVVIEADPAGEADLPCVANLACEVEPTSGADGADIAARADLPSVPGLAIEAEPRTDVAVDPHDRDALLQALAIIEQCVDLLRAARHDRS